jgi:hypothetical protein
MEDGKWQRAANPWRFAIFHLPFTLQDAFFSILLDPGAHAPDHA